MTYRHHMLLQASGPLFDTEQWSINLRIRIGGGEAVPSDIFLDQWEEWTRDNVADIATDVANYVQDPRATFSTAAELETVKLNVINPDGRYRNPSETVRYDFPTNARPDGTLTPGPAQLALVVSTLTAAQRGRGSRGRWYVPCGALGVDEATGRISAAVANDAVAAAKDFVDDLNNQPGFDVNNPRLVVASNLGNPGPMRAVEQVAVGNVIDTQRRRRGDLPEQYVALPVSVQ